MKLDKKTVEIALRHVIRLFNIIRHVREMIRKIRRKKDDV